MSKISILDIEQRFDIENERNKLEEDFVKRYLFNSGESLINLINQYILKIPFNKTSRSINEYFFERSIGKEFGTDDIEIYLYRTNFYLNFFSWYFENICHPQHSYRKNNVIQANFIIEIINYTLEKINYCATRLEKDDNFNFSRIIFTKRSVEVDSVLPFVSSDIRIDLLTFLDFRNENNLNEKEAIIGRIYKDLEEKKDILNTDPYKPLFKNTKQALNFARHKHSEIAEIEKIKICDQSFYMYIHLIRWPEIRKYQENLKFYSV